MYNIETLKAINPLYDHKYRITQGDVNMSNKWVKFIESSRNNKSPQVGDIVEFTTKHGDYYKNAHIEKINWTEEKKLNICEQPHTPFVGIYQNSFYTNTSGGIWRNIPSNLRLIGKRGKFFTDWGHCGACAHGAIEFVAIVNVWEHIEPDNLYDNFSTKTHDKFYVSVIEDENKREKPFNYKYIITKGVLSHIAFRTDREYQAWLKTFKGIEFKTYYPNERVVWTYKQIEKCVPFEEYRSTLCDYIDSTLNNGAIQECKRFYEGTTITTILPYQKDKISLGDVKFEYMNCY